MMKVFLILQVCFLTFFMQISSCNHKEDDPIVKWKGLDDKNDLVFLYQKNTTYEDKKRFENSVLYKPYIQGYGQAHQDGIADLLLGKIVGDYEGGVINFSKDATSEQREKLKKAIEESPIVYKVYENVVPSEIKDL